jgi:AraC family transcriptional regulator
MPVLSSTTLFECPIVRTRDVQCFACKGRHVGPEEYDAYTHIAVPYRGSFVRWIGTACDIADPNQAVFFNSAEGYRIDHIANHGDACMSMHLRSDVLEELGSPQLRMANGAAFFTRRQQRIGPGTQLAVARLRDGNLSPLQIEESTIAIASDLLATTRRPRTRVAQRRLVGRAKLLLNADLERKWSLHAIASNMKTSIVYLTQSFREVEGMPMYKYYTNLRLARSLHELSRSEDIADIALKYGFSSHSQYSSAFVRTYGMSPSTYRGSTAQHKSLKNRKAR